MVYYVRIFHKLPCVNELSPLRQIKWLHTLIFRLICAGQVHNYNTLVHKEYLIPRDRRVIKTYIFYNSSQDSCRVSRIVIVLSNLSDTESGIFSQNQVSTIAVLQIYSIWLVDCKFYKVGNSLFLFCMYSIYWFIYYCLRIWFLFIFTSRTDFKLIVFSFPTDAFLTPLNIGLETVNILIPFRRPRKTNINTVTHTSSLLLFVNSVSVPIHLWQDHNGVMFGHNNAGNTGAMQNQLWLFLSCSWYGGREYLYRFCIYCGAYNMTTTSLNVEHTVSFELCFELWQQTPVCCGEKWY